MSKDIIQDGIKVKFNRGHERLSYLIFYTDLNEQTILGGVNMDIENLLEIITKDMSFDKLGSNYEPNLNTGQKNILQEIADAFGLDYKF